ncbi:galectin-4-like isoform X2 [Syngnathus scovelli]|uniref:galectin-4-like isoform X2 n=1 Tax=Syngnathus scovelli TaxID=161590 RepID=UPI0035C9D3D5
MSPSFAARLFMTLILCQACTGSVCPITTVKPVTCPTPVPCPTTTTAKPVTCPTPAPCPTTAKPATCPTPPPCPTTTKPATCPPCTTITTTKAAPCPTPAPCPTTAKPATCPDGPPPTDGELELCAISTNEMACSSHNVTCSCLLAMTANPGGVQAVLDGLSVARSIVIRGQSNPKAKSLVVNLDVRDSNGNVTTALQLNMDLESQTFTLNSRVGRKWGDKQTGDLPQGRPFGAGLPFKIVIKCGSGTFHLDLNDELQVDFTGPQLDIKRINLLEVWQVMLSGVQLM